MYPLFPVLKTQFDAEEASSLQQQRSYRVRQNVHLTVSEPELCCTSKYLAELKFLTFVLLHSTTGLSNTTDGRENIEIVSL